jgi:hypothetical protein
VLWNPKELSRLSIQKTPGSIPTAVAIRKGIIKSVTNISV